MKQIILVVFLALLTLSLQAQDCKPKKSFDDSFSGIHYDLYGGRMDIPKSTFVGQTTYIDIYLFESDSLNYIMLRTDIYQREYDVAANPIALGDSAMFQIRTSVGVMDFSTEIMEHSKSKMGVNIITTSQMHAFITEEQVEVLSNNPILSYRILPAEYSIIQGQVAKKKAAKLRAQFECYKSS